MPKWRSPKRGFLFGVPQPIKGQMPPNRPSYDTRFQAWRCNGAKLLEEERGIATGKSLLCIKEAKLWAHYLLLLQRAATHSKPLRREKKR